MTTARSEAHLEAAFRSACERVRAQSARDAVASESDKRILYACYKVATVGPRPDVPRPFHPLKARYWEAWESFGSKLDRDTARERYVATVERLESGAVERAQK